MSFENTFQLILLVWVAIIKLSTHRWFSVGLESGWNLGVIGQRGPWSSLKGPRQHLKGNTVRCRPGFPRGQEPTNGRCSAIGIQPQNCPPTHLSNNAEKAGNGSIHHGPQLLKNQEISPEGNLYLLAILPLQETRGTPAKWPLARVLPEFSLRALSSPLCSE